MAQLPAVDGVNGEFGGFGGGFNQGGLGLAEGKISTPLTPSIGTQFDGSVGSIDGQFYGSSAAATNAALVA